jgi:hypothetical protein
MLSLRWSGHAETPDVRRLRMASDFVEWRNRAEGYEARCAPGSDSDATLRGRNQRLAIGSKCPAYCCKHGFWLWRGERRNRGADRLDAHTMRTSASVARCVLVVSSQRRNRRTLREILARVHRHASWLSPFRHSEGLVQQCVERAASKAPYGKDREDWMAQFE